MRIFMNSLLEEISDAYIEADLNGKILSLNLHAKRMFIKGENQNIFDLKNPTELKEIFDQLKKVMQEKSITKKTIENEKYKVVYESWDHKASILIVKHDINLEREKSFISNASHELRTPITIIQGYAESLYELVHEEKNREILKKIIKNSHRLSDIVTNLLALSKCENNSFYRRRPTKIHKFLEHCKQNIDELSLDVHIKINCDDLVEGNIDEKLLEMAVMNLLQNSIRYCKEKPHIELTAYNEGNQLILEIQDNGIGIPPEDRDKIFNRFYTVDKARTANGKGTGLGLSIVHSIIQNHHGKIEVYSQMENGSKFKLYLPLQK